MTAIKNSITNAASAPVPNTPVIKPLIGSPLGKAQVALTQLGELPDGFAIPTVDEMAYGEEACCHFSDVEHVQEVDGRRFVTSVVWTTDAGYGVFPSETVIGCQWVASVREEVEPASIFDIGWEYVVEVLLDCDADAPNAVAIAEAMRVLTDAVNGTF